jgi:hypothetical protein
MNFNRSINNCASNLQHSILNQDYLDYKDYPEFAEEKDLVFRYILSFIPGLYDEAIAKVTPPKSPAGGLLMKSILCKSPCGDLGGER